eukprot:347072-Amphidinium_carterae.1
MLSSMLASFALPFVRNFWQGAARSKNMLAMGRLLCVWFVPCTVAVYLADKCLGGWTSQTN